MAILNNVSVEEAELWREGHEKRYPGWHTYAKEVGGIGSARGWIDTPYGKRIRFVNEDNSKGEGASPARSAVNMTIQGTAAEMSKLALQKVLLASYGHDRLDRAVKVLRRSQKRFHLIGFVHDEQ